MLREWFSLSLHQVAGASGVTPPNQVPDAGEHGRGEVVSAIELPMLIALAHALLVTLVEVKTQLAGRAPLDEQAVLVVEAADQVRLLFEQEVDHLLQCLARQPGEHFLRDVKKRVGDEW